MKTQNPHNSHKNNPCIHSQKIKANPPLLCSRLNPETLQQSQKESDLSTSNQPYLNLS